MPLLQQAYVEALYHAHFDRWDCRRLTYTWWTSLINDVATSHHIDALLDRHPLPVPTQPYTHVQSTGREGDKRDRISPLSPTRPTGSVDKSETGPDSDLVPFSRPLVPFSCSTSDGHSRTTVSSEVWTTNPTYTYTHFHTNLPSSAIPQFYHIFFQGWSHHHRWQYDMWGRHPPYSRSILCNQSNHRSPSPHHHNRIRISILSVSNATFTTFMWTFEDGQTSLSLISPCNSILSCKHFYHTDFSSYNWLWMEQREWPWHRKITL